MQKYKEDIEKVMKLFFESLNEKDRRHYAALESMKLGHGGKGYIAKLFDIDEKTIYHGQIELKKKELLTKRIRKTGSGRKNLIIKDKSLESDFKEVVSSNTAGSPMEAVTWTYLTQVEIKEKLTQKGHQLSLPIVKQLLKKSKLGKRKMSKKGTIKTVQGRNAQFEHIAWLRKYYTWRGWAVISIDVKKKEYLGNLYREGTVYTVRGIKCYDHDFNSLANGKLVPQGIWDINRKEGFITMGQSGDTAEFTCDCINLWWQKYGSKIYNPKNPILILCDGGGANGSTNSMYKTNLQSIANEFGLKFRIAHYPAYCSKYNPIEHQLFPIITRSWKGIILDNENTAKELIEKRCENLKSGAKVVVNTINKIYETGKKTAKNYLDNLNIFFDKVLPKWNYRINFQT